MIENRWGVMPLSRRPDIPLFEELETSSSQRNEHTPVIDLRRAPRVETRFAAEAVGENGERVFVAITNISQSGLRIEGSRRMVAALLPGSELQGSHTAGLIQVSFSVSIGSDHFAVVRAECRTAYVRCDEEGAFQIGMQFTEFDEGREAFTKYVSRRVATG